MKCLFFWWRKLYTNAKERFEASSFCMKFLIANVGFGIIAALIMAIIVLFAVATNQPFAPLGVGLGFMFTWMVTFTLGNIILYDKYSPYGLN